MELSKVTKVYEWFVVEVLMAPGGEGDEIFVTSCRKCQDASVVSLCPVVGSVSDHIELSAREWRDPCSDTRLIQLHRSSHIPVVSEAQGGLAKLSNSPDHFLHLGQCVIRRERRVAVRRPKTKRLRLATVLNHTAFSTTSCHPSSARFVSRSLIFNRAMANTSLRLRPRPVAMTGMGGYQSSCTMAYSHVWRASCV